MSNERVLMGIPAKQSFMRGMKERFNGISPRSVIIFFVLVLLLVSSVHASDVRNPFYYRNTTPQNDPNEFIVKPGDTIYLGKIYDLRYVMGSSKQFAWWKDWKVQGTDCSPDIVNSISYIDTWGNVTPKNVYIDPAKYRIGNWWQWDGCFMDYNFKTGEKIWRPYTADNNLAFRIVNPPPTSTPSPTPEPTIITPTPTPSPSPTIPVVVPAKPGFPWGYLIITIIVLVVIVFVVVI